MTGKKPARQKLAVQAIMLVLAAVSAVIASGCDRAALDGGSRTMRIGTGGTGGIYYPLGRALAERLTAADTARRYTVEATGGSVENISRISDGDLDLGFAVGTSVFEAYYGGRDFDEPFSTLRVVAPLYPNLTHVLVPTASTVQSLSDLRGRRVSVGPAGSGTEQVAQQVLEAVGVGYDDIDERHLAFSESASALANGEIDAAILSVGYPASAVLDVTTKGRARLMPVDAEVIRQLTRRHAYYSAAEIPAGAYPGMTAPIPTLSALNWVVAREGFPDHAVVALLDILRNDAETLRRTVDIAGQINLNNLYAAPIPIHRAARGWLESSAEGS